MSTFPTSRPTYAGFTSSHTLATDNHASQHNSEQADIGAMSDKIGLGSSTPTSGVLLRGTGSGTSSWAQANLMSDVTGVLPVANGGTGITSLGGGVATFLSTPTSANLAGAVSDETGTGSLVFANTPTLATPMIGDFTNANHNHSNAAGGGAIDQSALPLGTVVQVVSTNFSAVASGTTTIPFDDTIPQITEGTEFMTQAITPKSATNRLNIEATLYGSYSIVAELIVALFQDSTANALAADSITIAGNAYLAIATIKNDMVAGTTSSTTFRIRAGGSSAGTITFNGNGAARKFGGITLSSIKITEYKA